MIYADTDFFLALLKPDDRLKENARKILEKYRGDITTSDATFIELLLLAERYGLDPIKIVSSVMALCGIEDTRYLKAAIYVKEYGLKVFDAFHAAGCGGRIISSDSVYDKLGITRIDLRKPSE